MSKAVLASGGFDSNLLLYTTKPNFAIHANYGQPTFGAEKKFIQYHCEKLGIKYVMLEMVFEGYMGYKRFVADEKDLICSGTDDIKKNWIEGRNLKMVTEALMYCSNREIEILYVGFERKEELLDDDELEYGRDCSPAFVRGIQEIIPYAFEFRPMFIAPYIIGRTFRPDMLREGIEYGINESNTIYCIHCYPPCEKCFKCKMMYADLREAGISKEWYSNKM